MDNLIIKELYIKLSWALGEFSMMYFYPQKVHQSWHKELTISDQDYDRLEMIYEKVADKLGKSKRNTNQFVGFGEDTMAANAVITKLKSSKGSSLDGSLPTKPVISSTDIKNFLTSNQKFYLDKQING